MKKTKLISKRIFILCLLIFLFNANSGFSQSNSANRFPQGSYDGTTQMGSNVSPVQIPNVNIQLTEPRTGRELAFNIRLLLIITILTIAPSILLLTTCFLRFSIVLDFIKRALSLQQVPPTAILNGIAFFMTLFVMWPTFYKIYDEAFKPLSDGNIEFERAYQNAEAPLKEFMLLQMNLRAEGSSGAKSIAMFMNLAKMSRPSNNDFRTLPMYIVIPSYVLHELTVAFKIGIVLYIPFIIIDMVVASILMSMGMMMLPPVQISMPFKLLLFVLVDGWGLITQQLFDSVLQFMKIK